MGNQLELLEAEALQLTAGERVAFAQLLLASLDEDAEIEEAWAAETEHRIADIESGATPVIPIADALAQVRASLKWANGVKPHLPAFHPSPAGGRRGGDEALPRHTTLAITLTPTLSRPREREQGLRGAIGV